MFSIEHGTVEIVREFADGGEEILATASAPGYVGELGPLLGFPRSATVRAAGPATLRPFTAAQFRVRATTAAIDSGRSTARLEPN